VRQGLFSRLTCYSKLASFLGDPRFPEIILKGNRGEQIRWYQELYAQYSRLGLSHPEDRPIAIQGLESRLISTFSSEDGSAFRGGYGVLFDGPSGGLFHRSLLWRRGHDTPSLERINFDDARETPPPSWSWMAYKGGIDFIPVPGNTVTWEVERLASPWSGRRRGQSNTARVDAVSRGVLVARAYEYRVELTRAGAASTIIPDSPRASVDSEVRCVLVGTEKHQPEEGSKERTCYVLIVRPDSVHWRRKTVGYPDYRVYKRIGAGSIPERCISLGDEGENILIV
jgi:hypothetical protein